MAWEQGGARVSAGQPWLCETLGVSSGESTVGRLWDQGSRVRLRGEWDGLYQQQDRACGLGGSYTQGPATGETGTRGPATGQALSLSPAAGGLCLAHVCTFSLTSGLPGNKGPRGDTGSC